VSGLVQILEGEVGGLWDSGEPEEDWLQLFSKAASAILEVPPPRRSVTFRCDSVAKTQPPPHSLQGPCQFEGGCRASLRLEAGGSAGRSLQSADPNGEHAVASRRQIRAFRASCCRAHRRSDIGLSTTRYRYRPVQVRSTFVGVRTRTCARLNSPLKPRREVAEMSSTDMVHNTEGARHIATLLCGIAETQPIHAQHNLHLLLPLLEAEVRRISSFTS
jgi:hypothetical protein